MKPSSLIGHVCELLDLIRPLKQPADAIVKDFFRTRHYLGSKDRRFISETTYGILRHYKLVKFYADDALKKSDVPSFPPIALYISFAARIQKQDAALLLSDVESSWRISFPKISCEQFIQAVARVELSATALENPTKRIALVHSFPEMIVEEWIQRFGPEETERLCEASNQSASIVVRVNSLKASVDECRARLLSEGIESEPTKLSLVGLVLKKRINAQALQSFKDGWFEMQDEGSQLLSLLLELKAGQVIVDACAGGGGKSVHIAALMKNEGELYAIDVDEKRLRNIEPRLSRSGATNVKLLHVVRDKEAIDALKGRTNAVLVDAPCSGVGTFRRNPAAKLSFSNEFVERIAAVQRSVLETYSAMVKSGGRLVYTTCTLMRKENEDIVDSFLQSHPEFSLISASEILRRQNVSVESQTKYLTLLPHVNGTDGFFAAALQKP